MMKGWPKCGRRHRYHACLCWTVFCCFDGFLGTNLSDQVDNSQLTVQLLSNISIQLSSPSTQIFSLNPTGTDVASAPFQAPASTVAINTLLFLSLVFSLAAALFGILVKQWLREYLQWNHVLAPPRENIFVRQMQFEAWQNWKAPAVISAIPVLLEIGVVLFFSGLIIFLWTLERRLAIVVTIPISMFLVATCLFTLLPIVSRHCPYKSPTGWVLFYLYQSLRRLVQFFGTAQLDSWPVFGDSVLEQWRQRDLRTIDVSSEALHRAADLSVDHESLLSAHKVILLLRAFSWVLCGSESDHLRQNVWQCLQSVHRTADEPHQRQLEGTFRHHATIIALYELDHVQQGILPFYRSNASRDPVIREIGIYMFTWAGPLPLGMDPRPAGSYGPRSKADSTSQRILGRLVLSDLQTQADLWIRQLVLRSGTKAERLENYRTTTRKIVELLSAVCLYVQGLDQYGMTEEDKTSVTPFLGLLKRICDENEDNRIVQRTGITAMMLEVFCSMANDVSFHSSELKVDISETQRRLSHGGTLQRAVPLALHFSDGDNSIERRHMFILLSNFSLRVISRLFRPRRTRSFSTSFVQETQEVTRLLTQMQGIAEQSRTEKQLNCGGLVDLPWIGSLADALKQDKALHESGMASSCILTHDVNKRKLIRPLPTLEDSLYEGLISGSPRMAKDLAKRFQLLDLHRADNSYLPYPWQWRVDGSDRVFYVRHDTSKRTEVTVLDLPRAPLPPELEDVHETSNVKTTVEETQPSDTATVKERGDPDPRSDSRNATSAVVNNG